MSAVTPKLDNVRLLVENFDACVKFYAEVMGFKVPEGHGYPYISMETGKGVIALFDRAMMRDAINAPTPATPTDNLPDDRAALIFEVDNVDKAYAELAGRGALFVAPPTDRELWGIRTAHLRDPDGNLIEIYEALKPAG